MLSSFVESDMLNLFQMIGGALKQPVKGFAVITGRKKKKCM